MKRNKFYIHIKMLWFRTFKITSIAVSIIILFLIFPLSQRLLIFENGTYIEKIGELNILYFIIFMTLAIIYFILGYLNLNKENPVKFFIIIMIPLSFICELIVGTITELTNCDLSAIMGLFSNLTLLSFLYIHLFLTPFYFKTCNISITEQKNELKKIQNILNCID